MAKKKTLQIQAESDDLTVPQDRIEGFLAKAAGLVDTMPEGQFSRLERYLALIAEGGGSGADIEELKQEMQDLFVPKTIGPTPLATFQDGVDGAILGKCIVDIEPVQAGSGDPSPTNIRPISGWTEANVSVTGKNLLNITAQENARCKLTVIRYGNHITIRAEAKVSGTYTNVRVRIIPSLNEFIGKKLTISLGGVEPSISGGYVNCAVSITPPGTTSDSGGWYPGIGTRTIQITEAHQGMELDCLIYATGSEENPIGTYVDYKDIQLEIGDTATEYEPYQGNTYNISFGEAGTVYGGTLDVGTGLLTVDRAKDVFNGNYRFSLTQDNDEYFTCSAYLRNITKPYSKQQMIINEGLYGDAHDPLSFRPSLATQGGTLFAFVEKTLAADIDAFNAWIINNPIEVCYELATPKTYQLTPTQVRTLLGLNNIYADTGNITVEYRGDILNLYKLIG